MQYSDDTSMRKPLPCRRLHWSAACATAAGGCPGTGRSDTRSIRCCAACTSAAPAASSPPVSYQLPVQMLLRPVSPAHAPRALQALQALQASCLCYHSRVQLMFKSDTFVQKVVWASMREMAIVSLEESRSTYRGLQTNQHKLQLQKVMHNCAKCCSPATLTYGLLDIRQHPMHQTGPMRGSSTCHVD